MLPKRILYCIPALSIGGTERQLIYLSQSLLRMGWDVHIALLRHGNCYNRIQSSNIKVHVISCRGNYDPTIIYRLYKVIKIVEPAIVQTHIPIMDILGGIATSFSKKPWILSERSSSMNYRGSWKAILRSLIAINATAIVANSALGADYWKDRVPKHITRHVIRNIVPLKDIENIEPINKEKLGVQLDHKLILYAGRLCEQKNINNIILGFREVLLKSHSVVFLCGDGPLRLHVQDTLRKYSIQDRVHILGHVDNIWAWMKAADVFVSASLWEGMSNAVVEAMLCACPLVVSDIPEHREFINEDSALLVDPNRPDSIADGILSCFKDSEKVASRVRHAREIALGLSSKPITQEYIKVYESIIEATK